MSGLLRSYLLEVSPRLRRVCPEAFSGSVSLPPEQSWLGELDELNEPSVVVRGRQLLSLLEQRWSTGSGAEVCDWANVFEDAPGRATSERRRSSTKES